jgi:Cyclic-phosphate processing Receiver domain
MFCLFVDDIRPSPDGWVHIKTITEAIRILSGPVKVDLISLDHDILFAHDKIDDFSYRILKLAEEMDYVVRKEKAHKVAMSDETFATVARYISLMSKEKLPKIVAIHTASPIGANDIELILEGIVPTIRVGDSCNFDLSSPLGYKEDLVKLAQKYSGEINE